MLPEHATSRRCIRTLTFVAVIMTIIIWAAAPAAGQDRGNHESHRQQASEPINTMCPIGKEPIVRKVATIQYKGHTLGFCCPGCDKDFLAWPESKRDEFVRLALAGQEPGLEQNAEQATTQTDEIKSDPYLLGTCPISGQALGSMGDPVVKEIDGREVRFCCAGCVEPFEKEKAKHFGEIDKKLIEQQLPYYPLDTCVVMGDPLVEDGEDIAVNHIFKNRLVRFCCKMCIKEFEENPRKFLDKLDKAVVEKQRGRYPLDTCVISGQELGSMGKPVEKVYGNRLVRFCCAGCVKPFEESPTDHFLRLDKAWKATGAMPGTDAGHHDDAGHGDRGAHHDHDG